LTWMTLLAHPGQAAKFFFTPTVDTLTPLN
jgi:hypothetical protein